MMCSGLMVWLVEEFVISFPPSVNSLLLAGIAAAPYVCFLHKADSGNQLKLRWEELRSFRNLGGWPLQRSPLASQAQREDTKMFSKTAIVLSAAIVLSVGPSASAATKHHRVSHVHPSIYNSESKGCTASGGPACSGACLPSGPPCAPLDRW